ncbi:ABC transporter substrate-binding protein [uncultured Brachyspira sp.]|uniref:ABC transporter substrate-binding protein n=1 Tax=uncultured Brachyspira sp. TaxID=221953 RepID=UPI00261FE017|nr:ABC transporter substrate-binding protein [uncultured Brachyspira sp.]
MKKIIYIIFYLVFIISCNSNEVKEFEKENTENNFIKIKVGYISDFAGASAIAIAKKKGFFEEENLDAQLFQFYNGHSAILSIISKEIDFSYIGHAAHNLIINGKAQILVPNSISKSEKIIVNKDSNINSISDLKGKNVAAHFGTSGEIMLYMSFKKAGLNKKDVNLMNINITNLENYLINGKADAISTWLYLTNDYKVLAYITNYSDDIILTSSFVSSLEYINKYPQIAEKFSRAILKAMDYRKYNINEAAELTAELIGNKADDVKKEIDSGIWFSSSDIENALKSDDILRWYEAQEQVFLYYDTIKEAVPVTNYIQLEMLKNIVNNL